MSDEDLPKGKRWLIEVAKQLSGSSFGIVCLTPENLESPWVHFEAGALSKLEGAYLWTYLHDLKPADVKGPLEDFQHTQFSKDEIKKLVGTINSASETKLEEQRFNETFETYWPKMEERLKQIPKNPSSPPIKRRVDDMVLEILERVRDLSNRPVPPLYAAEDELSNYLRHRRGRGTGATHLMGELLRYYEEPHTSSPSPEPPKDSDD
jgi:hypothetical protein